MPDETAKEMGIEQLGTAIQEQRKALPLLQEELRPSRKALEQYIPNPDIYNVAHPGGADLPHHGVLHGEETVILTAILLNVAYQDVRARLGLEKADAFRASLDEEALLYAAAYHDCGRISDWRLFQGKEEIRGKIYKGEMQLHGPRGAEVVRQRPEEINPALSDKKVELMASLIALHTPTREESRAHLRDLLLGKFHIATQAGAARKAARERHFEDYDPEELMLRLLQKADSLGLPRGYYSRKVDDPRRTPFAVATSAARVVKGNVPILRNRPGTTESRMLFPQTTELDLKRIADELTRTSRRDPEVERKFAHVPHRSGAAMEAGERIGILKP